MRNNNKKRLVILALAFIAVFMGVGYSLLSTTLSISSINRTTGSWDIHINSLSTVVTTSGKGTSRDFSVSNDGLSATFEVDLFEEGDSVQYQMTVVNNGNVPAKLSNVQTSSVNGSNFIKMSTTAAKDTIVNPNGSYTFTVTIYVDNPDSLMLEDVLGAEYTLDLFYVQNT